MSSSKQFPKVGRAGFIRWLLVGALVSSGCRNSFTKPVATDAGEGSKAGELRSDNTLEMKLVWCPKGSFKMGSPNGEAGRTDDENQVYVTLTNGFWLGQTSVTQQQWNTVMTSNRSPWRGKPNVKEGDDYPARCVSALDADAFLNQLNDHERTAGRLPSGWHYALPTEAQREYATRAGTTETYSFGDTDTRLSEYGWWGGFWGVGNCTTEQYVHQVGQKKPNPWGLYDMHGNVFEWCRDMHAHRLPGGTDPLVSAGSNRVFRGGSWGSDARDCRSASRCFNGPSDRDLNVGFRVVLER